jgi:hypothetical protein
LDVFVQVDVLVIGVFEALDSLSLLGAHHSGEGFGDVEFGVDDASVILFVFLCVLVLFKCLNNLPEVIDG